MRLFLLSLLAIGSVQALAIGYPYRSGLVGYNPARGEFPVKSSVVQGYLRYLDSHGVERLVGYSYPEPVYGVRQVSYVSRVPTVSSPVISAFNQEASSEFLRAQEAHFRAWSLQQYQALKREIDALRAEGKAPSADMLAKFQPLERIALTSDYAAIAELPEVRGIRDEHLRIWNEARIQSLQSEAGQQPLGEIKTYAGHNVPLVPVEETPEQKLARQEHLRIYNEQLSRLRQLQEQRDQNVEKVPPSTDTLIAEQLINRLASQSNGITEVERATQEHLRLWNEAKVRAEQASYQQSEGKPYGAAAEKQVISELKQDQIVPQPQQIVQASGEHQKSREEHLRLVQEATAKIQNVEAPRADVNTAEVSQLRFSVPAVQQQQHVVVDTPEVVRARAEHLRLVNEARLRAESVEQDELKHKHVVQVPVLKAASPQPQQTQYLNFQAALPQASLPTSIADTPEVTKAREEHLRLVNEAKLQIQSVDQQPRILAHQAEYNTALPIQPPQIADSPEVIKAREEHLRLVNEAKLKLQSVEQQLRALEHQADLPVVQHQHQIQLNAQPQIADTPEVIKAREEHLRLVNEAKLKAQSVEHRPETVSPLQQQQQNIQPRLEETPEVIQARQEHLRIFNEIKAHAEKEQSKHSEIKASGFSYRSQQSPEETEQVIQDERQKEELRLLELERVREAERLQEDQKLVELERMREAERLAEEQRQMESELIRLKLEEEQRLALERSMESQRLKAEQEQLQQIIIADEFKSTPNQDIFIIGGHRQQQQQQQQLQYVANPFLRSIVVDEQNVQQPIQQQQQEQEQYFKSTQPLAQYPVSVPEKSSQTLLAGTRSIQSSEQSIGSKHQHLKDDSIKIQSSDHANYQPADTAAVLIQLEKARQEHFRAHEQALEQLRLARVQNPSLKDCNH